MKERPPIKQQKLPNVADVRERFLKKCLEDFRDRRNAVVNSRRAVPQGTNSAKRTFPEDDAEPQNEQETREAKRPKFDSEVRNITCGTAFVDSKLLVYRTCKLLLRMSGGSLQPKTASIDLLTAQNIPNQQTLTHSLKQTLNTSQQQRIAIACKKWWKAYTTTRSQNC